MRFLPTLIVVALATAGIVLMTVEAADTSNADYASSTELWVHSFEQDTANTEPADLNKQGTNNLYKATTTEAWNGDASIVAVGGGSIEHGWGYFDQETITTGDYEVSTLVNFRTFNGDRAGVVGRAAGTTGYICALRNGNSLRLGHYDGTTEVAISTISTSTISTDTWYRIKMVFDGTSIKCRFWDNDQQEPSGWDIDTTDATISNTQYGVGVYGYVGNGNDIYFDELTARNFPALPYASPANLSQEIQNAWSGWKGKFLRWDGAIEKTDNLDVVSEGISYAMMMAVQLNDRETFDRVETFASSTLERRHQGESVDPHLMGFRLDASASGNTFVDNNWASDADNDRAIALLWAHGRWGSDGDVNYLKHAEIQIEALKNTFNEEGAYTLQVPYTSEVTDTDPEINPSYWRPSGFRLFQIYDAGSAAFWEKVENNGWYMLTSHTDNAGSLPTSAGLPADWMSWDTNGTDEAAAPNGGGHTTDYGFESFRIMPFVEMHRQFYGTGSTTDYFNDQVGDFFADYYTSTSSIPATFNHNGDTPAGYSLSYFNWAAFFAMQSANPSVASTFYSAELDDIYNTTAEPTGVRAYIGSDGYYGGAWNIMSAMLYNGDFVNWAALEEPGPANPSYIIIGNMFVQ